MDLRWSCRGLDRKGNHHHLLLHRHQHFLSLFRFSSLRGAVASERTMGWHLAAWKGPVWCQASPCPGSYHFEPGRTTRGSWRRRRIASWLVSSCKYVLSLRVNARCTVLWTTVFRLRPLRLCSIAGLENVRMNPEHNDSSDVLNWLRRWLLRYIV
jgi:hypothetical protein